MASVNDIRRQFLDYFGRNGHEIVSSSPLVPANDPTLLFTNAGMVQFKNVFTGLESRDYQRAVTSQKCVRAGGKHNDLDNVGYTARHHTFFEMLGNFSFGDYFKEQAIHHAWTLVTKEMGLPEEKLLVTVYSEDDEAADLWKKIAGLGDDRIIRIPTSDNFWQMGPTGPCGPCSEIFFDHGDHIWGGPPGTPEEDGDRFIEIWNLVFMQFEQFEDESRVALPKPSIDTGMGLERIAAVLQGKHNNYEIDLFETLIHASEELTGTKAKGKAAPSHKVIADHLRASTFLITDGVMPSNEGRGYVLRRILRRGIRHAYLLGAKDPLMHRLVPTLVGEMGEAFPELRRAQSMVTEILKLEEERFRQTLERGLKLLDQETDSLNAGDRFSGETAFKLYDTYGFPLDLTQDALRARDIAVDEEAFKAAMDAQKQAARASWKGSGSAAEESVWFNIRDEVGATEFLGYDSDTAEAAVMALIVDGSVVDSAEGENLSVSVVTNQTPFYGESGGQIGDTGTITGPDGQLTVTDTQKKLGDLFVHETVLNGQISRGQAVVMTITGERRQALRRAHSATHLLHEALRGHLGEHVAQKGSLVAPDRLRFDFSHHKSVEAVTIGSVETEVNDFVRQDSACNIRVMSQDDAVEAGARALFGEKYGDEVRVVTMGNREDGSTYSMELCGGTHIGRTGEIGLLRVVSESAVAGGVRRIEALTGTEALRKCHEDEHALKSVAGLLKVRPDDVSDRVSALLDERKSLQQEISKLRQQMATGGGAAQDAYETINGMTYAAKVLQDVPAKDLRGMADTIKQQISDGVICLIAVNDGKAAIVVSLAGKAAETLEAVPLLRQGVEALGGKGGGGRGDFAQGGGPNGDKAEAAIKAIADALN